jgi:hypothetical protein
MFLLLLFFILFLTAGDSEMGASPVFGKDHNAIEARKSSPHVM